MNIQNTKVSSRVSDIRALCGLISSPLWENTLSTGADVAGVHNSRLKFTVHQKTTRIQSFMRWKCSSISLPKHEPCKAKDLVGQGQGLLLKAKAKALTFKAKAKAKDLTLKAKFKAEDSAFFLEDTPRPRTKAKDNNTDLKWNQL